MSWINASPDSHFPIQNLPFGVFSTSSDPQPRPGVAIGEFVLDLQCLHCAGLLSGLGFSSLVFCEPNLNAFMALERSNWRSTRSRLFELLSIDNIDTRLSGNNSLQAKALVPLTDVTMHMPAVVGDYTDFYSSREHATNVGIMLRGIDNALQPNWLHLPVGYHGRSSTVVITGTDVVRPHGQIQADPKDPKLGPIFAPCRTLDFELEMAFFLGGTGNPMGRPLTIQEAEDRIFGVVIMNDWSARDLQAWEYVPLGPFTAKNFATSISPWIVSLDALEPFRCSTSAGAAQVDPEPLPYLQDPDYATSSYNIGLEVLLQGQEDEVPSTISRSNLMYMYWNMKQQLVHHSVSGCSMNAGDLLGTGTISGVTPDSLGSMLELSWRGSREVAVVNSTSEGNSTRKFLKDGDRVAMTGFAQGEGYRIGFGEVTGKVLPAGSTSPPTITEAPTVSPPSSNLKLHSYWRSSCSYRVRIALNLKQLHYEYIPVNLLPLVGNTTEQLPADYTTLNPMEQLPTLEVVTADGSVENLTQSLAIIEYIDEVFPENIRLLPKSALLKARTRQIAEIINSGIQPLHNIGVLRQVKAVELVGGGEGDGKTLAVHALQKGLSAIEALVSAFAPVGSSLYAAGTPTPSLADVCLVPQIYAARRFAIDLSVYPSIMEVCTMCETLEAFQAALPENQPDFKS